MLASLRSTTCSIRPFALLSMLVLLTGLALGCGDDGGGGSGDGGGDDPAEIAEENVADLGVAAASAAWSVIAGDDLPDIPTPAPATTPAAASMAAQAARSESESVSFDAGEMMSGAAPLGGDPFCPFGGFQNATAQGSRVTTTYIACRVTADITFDGAIIGDASFGSNSYTVTSEYDDFCVTIMLETTTQRCFDGQATTVRCTGISSPETIMCTVSTSAEGLDGRTYTISDSELAGDDDTGWDVSAEVVDPDWGRVGFETTESLFFECQNGAPSDGTIDYFDAGDVTATVEFRDCDTFAVCFPGPCLVPGDWDEYAWSEFGLAVEPE